MKNIFMITNDEHHQAEIDRLQAKITELAGMLLDYETKFDLMAENEAKRMIEFGEAVKLASIKAISNETGVQSINIKQLYTNFK